MESNGNGNGNGKVFNNPTKGQLAFDAVINEITDFIYEDELHRHAVIVGTDSEQRSGTADFVSVVVVHRIGKHGRYFWHRHEKKKMPTLRDRIYAEATMSLELAQEVIAHLKERIDLAKFGFEIHCDVGEHGATKDMIREITGMIRGNGFEPKIKPDSWGATKVADKHV